MCILTILILPPDIYHTIFDFTDISCVVSLSMTNKFFNEFCRYKLGYLYNLLNKIINYTKAIRVTEQNITFSKMYNTKILNLDNHSAQHAFSSYVIGPTGQTKQSIYGLDFPIEIYKLSSLKELHLGGNKLLEISPEIGNLKNLTYLNLNDNELSTLPTEIGNLHNLTSLDLSNNKLTTFPRELYNLQNLKHLFFHNNNFNGAVIRGKFPKLASYYF